MCCKISLVSQVAKLCKLDALLLGFNLGESIFPCLTPSVKDTTLLITLYIHAVI